MPDAGLIPNEGGDDRIVLAQVNESYWLIEGEHHLDAMLSGMKPFPTPVRCVKFESEFDLNLFLPDGQTLMSMWGIHPAIVSRLRDNGELMVVEPSNDD